MKKYEIFNAFDRFLKDENLSEAGKYLKNIFITY